MSDQKEMHVTVYVTSLEREIQSLKEKLNQVCSQRDRFWDELEMIRDIFKHAIKSKELKGGQQVPYHGDFANITPSLIKEMQWYVERWDKILPPDKL